MASHPIDERAISHTAEWNSWEEPQIFRDGAKWGYDQALADRAKVDAAKDAIVAWFRTMVEVKVDQSVYQERNTELLAALDAAKQEAGQCPNGSSS